MFDVHVITCLQTASRLPGILRSIQRLINNDQIKDIRLFCKSDIGFYSESNYTKQLWDYQIGKIYPLLAKNMQTISSRNIDYLLGLLKMVPSQLFPSRKLKPAEKSLLAKHYQSLRSVVRTTLILEDDCHVREGCEELIVKCLDLCNSQDVYADLGCYEGLNGRGKLDIYNDFEYYHCKIAMTRTTSAFILNPIVAKKLASCYWPCSLPADLHHQYLLLKENISGIWPRNVLTSHLSAEGKVKSCIQ